ELREAGTTMSRWRWALYWLVAFGAVAYAAQIGCNSTNVVNDNPTITCGQSDPGAPTGSPCIQDSDCPSGDVCEPNAGGNYCAGVGCPSGQQCMNPTGLGYQCTTGSGS